MNMFKKFVIIASVFVASVFADESFGGIGVVYKLTKTGAEVQEIIPNTPIDKTKIKPGNVIIAVDGVSVQGKKSREVKNALRGLDNKKLLAVLGDGKVVKKETFVSGHIEGVYVDDVQIPVTKDNPMQIKTGTAKIVSFNRSTIRVKLETAGAFIVSVVDSNGDIIRSFNENN